MSRVLGLDVGDKRIGVALSDEGRLIAPPLTVIPPPEDSRNSRSFST